MSATAIEVLRRRDGRWAWLERDSDGGLVILEGGSNVEMRDVVDAERLTWTRVGASDASPAYEWEEFALLGSTVRHSGLVLRVSAPLDEGVIEWVVCVEDDLGGDEVVIVDADSEDDVVSARQAAVEAALCYVLDLWGALPFVEIST